MRAPDTRPLIAHVVFRFDVGGLENGVVNLINRLPPDRFRHAVIAMTEVVEAFRERVERDDVEFVSLKKPPGPGYKLWPALFRTFRRMRPDVVHTRNLAPLEATAPAWLARVPVRVHGEHGWDVNNLRGENRSHRRARRFYRPFVTHYIALSRHIGDYLADEVGVSRSRICQIYNGVDTVRFRKSGLRRSSIEGSPFGDPGLWLGGTVGRLVDVKDQAGLIRAVAIAHRENSRARGSMRVVVVGGGPRRAALADLARSEGIDDAVWLAGERSDIPDVMRGLDAFVLPSLAEGISNTILEAMSSSLPVIATSVGGNPELIDDPRNGVLVPPADPRAIAHALLDLHRDSGRAERLGNAARSTVEARFSLDRMVSDYAALYDSLLASARGSAEGGIPAGERRLTS